MISMQRGEAMPIRKPINLSILPYHTFGQLQTVDQEILLHRRISTTTPISIVLLHRSGISPAMDGGLTAFAETELTECCDLFEGESKGTGDVNGFDFEWPNIRADIRAPIRETIVSAPVRLLFENRKRAPQSGYTKIAFNAR